MTKIGLSRNSGINGAMREELSTAIFNNNILLLKLKNSNIKEKDY